MDSLYEVLDELAGSSSSRGQGHANSDGESQNGGANNDTGPLNQGEETRTEEHCSDAGEQRILVDDGLDLEFNPRKSDDTNTRELYKENIQENCCSSDQLNSEWKCLRGNKSTTHISRERWLAVNDIVLTTSPCKYPPPTRHAPMQEFPFNQSNEHVVHIPIAEQDIIRTELGTKNSLEYAQTHDSIYDLSKSHVHQDQDLIDISTLDMDETVPKVAITSQATEMQKETAQSNDLILLFGPDTPSRSNVVDKKGKALVEIDQDNCGKQSRNIADMRDRELKQQEETEAISKIADVLRPDIKRWSAGKEGNLRALLSSLHIILERELEWRPISMAELLDKSSVRKHYKKATLLVHPDKLQQKRATPRQKYIAGKVFELLNEASKNFDQTEPI